MNKIFKYLKENEERAIYILLFFSIFIFSTIRLTLVDASLERDEGEYAYIAWLWMTGSGLPYVDAYSMKLPGIYIAYMAIFKFIGDGHQHIHMALILVNAVNTFFIFLISKKITNNYWGLVGAIFYLFLSFSLRFQGIFSQIEHFILLFALPAFYLSLKNNLKQKDFFIIGLLLGISFLMKQHAMFFALHTGIYLLIKIVFLDCDKNHKQTLIKFANLSAGFLLPFVITLLYFYTKSALHDMLFWTTEVARNYTNTTNFIDGISLFFKHRLYLFDDKILISALAAASLFIAIRKTFTKDSKSIFVVLFIMFSWITVSIGYYYRPHYLQLLAPVLAIGAVYFLFNIKILLEEKINKRFSRLIVHSIVIITLFSTFTVQLPYLYA